MYALESMQCILQVQRQWRVQKFARGRERKLVKLCFFIPNQARVQGGGGGGKGPAPLEIEKKKKKRSSEQILSYCTYILLFF